MLSLLEPIDPEAARMRRTIPAGLLALVAACGGTSSPAGKGDDLIVDVEASTTQEEPAEGSVPYGYAADGASLSMSDPQFGYLPDAYAVPAVCASTCTCAAGSFCFGGGRGSPAFSGTCDNASGVGVGCDPIPNACTDCRCLLAALAGQLPCVATCVPANGMTVYCP
jgi:hypothetical protein